MSPDLAAPVFAALGDPTRLALVGKLAAGRRQSISELARGASISRQAVTKHLRVLEAAGVVRSDREGRASLYAFRPEPLDRLRGYLDEVSAQWNASLERLRHFVED